MNIQYHDHFKKKYQKYPEPIQQAIKSRITLFVQNPVDPLLNNHKLKGKYKGYRSINITADFRAIYRPTDANTAYFVEVDNHNNLYK